MSIVRDIYNGLTMFMYYLILNAVSFVLFYIGPINLFYSLSQFVLLALWVLMGFYSLDRVCIVNKASCRFVSLFRIMVILMPALFIISLFSLSLYEDLGILLYLITESIFLAVSVVGFVGVLLLSRQFKKKLGVVGSSIAIVGIVFWLPMLQVLDVIGMILVFIGIIISIVVTLSIRRRYMPQR